jgi:hypothetical protein
MAISAVFCFAFLQVYTSFPLALLPWESGKIVQVKPAQITGLKLWN